ncbi:MAG TPA: hypothetical protein IAC31_09275 [Candidatus Faecousia intestinigallinarum]|nr:hypothetical protein [Candidatus Faecousia intestinigallinarum]
MSNPIKTLYVIHHSHTDIGYTDLQERVVYGQVHYIRTVLQLMQQPENADFRWNCETWFCVEQFLKQATPAEREAFFQLAREEKIGISGNYLNFSDLADVQVLKRRMGEAAALLREHGAELRTAMCADINGISMGQRDAMMDNGVAFLYTNIHCHHGMYPLYQNQTAYWWENAAGKRLLVWNGEHYNLGNVLGLKPNRHRNFMMENMLGTAAAPKDDVETLHQNLERYLRECLEAGYAYDFLVASVSGVFSDNAPPETEILRMIQAYNARYPEGVNIRMVSLQELYRAIRDKLADAPVYRGDLNDWWGNGVGASPYAVKHYRDAQFRYQLAQRLNPACREQFPELARTVEDNLLLYAEHTCGHSSTVTDPCDTMVTDLDLRKNSYASKAHEAASMLLVHAAEEKGDILRYYNPEGDIRVCAVSKLPGLQKVEFYVESPLLGEAEILRQDGTAVSCQTSPHPRGRLVTFFDHFEPGQERQYHYRGLPSVPETLNTRHAYAGAERVRDIVNTFDPVSFQLPYQVENRWFRLCYRTGEGISALINKATGQNLLENDSVAPFLTPLYEVTPLRPELPCACYEERRLLGRNVRGQHAKLYAGKLEEVVCRERGRVFTLLELRYSLPGTIQCSVFVKLYEAAPRMDFRLTMGKTMTNAIESVYLPLQLTVDGEQQLYLRKGTEPFRPGVDQLPGTGMEYSITDTGLVFAGQRQSALLLSRDVPLVYFGEMRHHPIRLCDCARENNRRPVYSWVMNNTWETNFRMDLSGFGEFRYSLWLSETTDPQAAMEELTERAMEPYPVIVG